MSRTGMKQASKQANKQSGPRDVSCHFVPKVVTGALPFGGFELGEDMFQERWLFWYFDFFLEPTDQLEINEWPSEIDRRIDGVCV